MMDIDELFQHINATLGQLWPTLKSIQEAHVAEHGIYFGCPVSHSNVPSGGMELAADNATVSFPHVGRSLADLVPDIVPNIRHVQVQVDTYESPRGPGYVLTVRMAWGSELWERALQVGPETHREYIWKSRRNGSALDFIGQ